MWKGTAVETDLCAWEDFTLKPLHKAEKKENQYQSWHRRSVEIQTSPSCLGYWQIALYFPRILGVKLKLRTIFFNSIWGNLVTCLNNQDMLLGFVWANQILFFDDEVTGKIWCCFLGMERVLPVQLYANFTNVSTIFETVSVCYCDCSWNLVCFWFVR